jgi:hypothetical protein
MNHLVLVLIFLKTTCRYTTPHANTCY